MRFRNPGTDADHVQHFSDGSRVEVWNDGEVCVYDSMDRDLDDYYVVPGDVPKLIRLLGSPLARWHHFMRDMVEDEVGLMKQPRRRRRNPSSFHDQLRSILSKARSNPMSRLRRRSRKARTSRRTSRSLTKKQRRALRKAAWRKQQAKRLAKLRARKARKGRKTVRRVSRKSRYSRKAVRRTSRRTVRKSRKSRYSRKARRTSRRGRKSRRNPGTHHFRGGMVHYQDDGAVTLTNDYGSTREYELDGRALRRFIPKVRKLKTFKAIERALGRGAILRQVNPKRRGRKSRRNCRNAPLRRRGARTLKRILRSHGYKCNPLLKDGTRITKGKGRVTLRARGERGSEWFIGASAKDFSRVRRSKSYGSAVRYLNSRGLEGRYSSRLA